MLNDIILLAVVFVLGYAIGKNSRNEQAEQKEQKTIEQVDYAIRKELEIAKNLNGSLRQDVEYLRNKLRNKQ